MKNLILALPLFLMSCSGCKKELPNNGHGNSVVYTIICDSCTANIDTKNELNKRIEVKKYYQKGEINDLKTINITTTGTGTIKTSLKVNGKMIHSATSSQNGESKTYKINID